MGMGNGQGIPGVLDLPAHFCMNDARVDLCKYRPSTSSMQKPLMRIPYTGPLPSPTIIPRIANNIPGAISALAHFLSAPPSPSLRHSPSFQHASSDPSSTVVISGAGISVASGLADYRGTNGTYRVNKTYRPIYYHEFIAHHEARKRYWARSFLGWTSLHKVYTMESSVVQSSIPHDTFKIGLTLTLTGKT